MGVRGLTTYISDNSKLYLKPYDLCDTYLVVDGNNIASHLYKWLSKSDSAFGGDYDEYYKIVKDFFNLLKKCHVTPIVLFDGGYEKKKIKTVLSRAGTKLFVLRSLNRNFSRAKFFPLFIKQTFFDVMDDLQILCVRCELEADVEIATVARALNCPVLSYDSDFFIYDVLYIPFSSVHTEAVRVEESGSVRFYIRCSIYDVKNFLNEFPGLDKSLLPIIATLLGNDYIQSSIFQKFFNHVIIAKNKNKSYTQRKIHGVLNWLKKESVESATKLILSHLENKNAGKVLKAINSNIGDYTRKSVSSSVVLGIDKLVCKKVDLKENVCTTKFPAIISEFFYQCRLDKFIMDVITLRTYFTPLQVEDVYSQSSHLPALELIRAIDSMLSCYADGDSKPLRLYLTVKNHYGATLLDSKSESINLDDILKEGVEVRLKALYNILGVDELDLVTISNFDDTWSVFVIGFVYWVKKLKNSLTLAHVHSLLLMATVNRTAQRNVGYYRNSSKFTKNKGSLIAKLSQTEELTPEEFEDDFEKLVSKVTTYECLLVQQTLIPMRQTTEKATGKAYSILTLHLFGCFQSCLYHIMQLNALLNYPLPHLKISDFYSGTLLFNFYVNIAHKADVEKFGLNLLKDAPNILNVYKCLYRCFERYTVRQPTGVKKEKKKNARKKEKEKVVVDEIILLEEEEEVEDGDDDDQYNDENNPYALLQSRKVRQC